MSLFGNTAASTSKPNLFGSINTEAANASQQQTSSASLFGNTAANTQQQSSSPFGTSQQNNNGSSLFGNNQQATQQQTSNLFGGTQTQQQPPSNPFGAPTQTGGGSTLFGQPAQQNSGGAFGSTTAQPQQQQQHQQPQQSTGLFGAPAPASSLTGSTLVGSSTANQLPGASTLGNPPQNGLKRSIAPVWQPGSVLGIRERSVPEQMQVLLEKWSPESPTCSFQAYSYDQAPDGLLTFFGPDSREDPQKWEDAYQKRPFPGAVPHLMKGFAELGVRLRTQVQAVQRLQQRIHEINSSLDAILSKHDLEVSVKILEAKRKHIALSQRSLRLATKIQVLRNRGYNLDSAEEDLKTKLRALERSAFDPALAGRCEEIWARMVGISERLRFLQQELDRQSNSNDSANGDSNGTALDEEVLRRTKIILSEHEKQISQVTKQVDEMRKDFKEWETSNTGAQHR